MTTEKPKTLREFLLAQFPEALRMGAKQGADWMTHPNFGEGQEMFEFEIFGRVERSQIVAQAVEFYRQQGYVVHTSAHGGFGYKPATRLVRNFLIEAIDPSDDAISVIVECF